MRCAQGRPPLPFIRVQLADKGQFHIYKKSFAWVAYVKCTANISSMLLTCSHSAQDSPCSYAIISNQGIHAGYACRIACIQTQRFGRLKHQSLVQAAQEPAGSIERFLMVAAFAVSGYSSTAGRTSKPFNPLLGETYELVHAEKGFRAVVEKVADLQGPNVMRGIS